MMRWTTVTDLLLMACLVLGSSDDVIFGASAAKVLLVPHQFRSHIIELYNVGEELIRRGHSVFAVVDPRLEAALHSAKELGITPVSFDVPPGSPDCRDVENEAIRTVFSARRDDFAEFTSAYANDMCDLILRDEQFMEEVKRQDFTLAVVDGFCLSSCTFLLPHNLSMPYVSAGSMMRPWIGGTPSLPSFVPTLVENHSDKMTFIERVKNFLLHVVIEYGAPIPGISNTTLLRRFAPGETWFSLEDNSMLTIVSRDHVLEWPAPRMPSVVFTPGITVKPASNLSLEFQEIASGSSAIIVMSFGTILRQVPLDTLDKFMDAFAQVDATVIVRYNGDLEQVRPPGNVHVFKWLPQNDLLGDPKTRLFITHCGNNGQYESVYHGVPMIGFPLFGDQPHNCYRAVEHQVGLELDILSFTSQQLVDAIGEVLRNPLYRDNARLKSAIIKDLGQTPREIIGYWIEHVIQYGGSHLRSRAHDMPWYKYLMLDVVLFCAVIIIAGGFLMVKFAEIVISLF